MLNQGFQITAAELNSTDYLDENAASAFYRIEDAPMNFKKDLTIKIKPEAGVSGNIFGVLIERSHVTGEIGARNTIRFLDVSLQNESYEFSIPPFDDVANAPMDTIHFFVGLIKNFERFDSKGHFAIYGPAEYASQVINLGNYLEEAYVKFKSPEFGFDYSRRTK